jgi:hypothetical protein
MVECGIPVVGVVHNVGCKGKVVVVVSSSRGGGSGSGSTVRSNSNKCNSSCSGSS